jgi:hypothetical protein
MNYMKLSDAIRDIGRPVAFYPGLKKLTNSTTATILLCQFLYWTDKTLDGWFWKSCEQLEEETGLTRDEQETARKKLKANGLMQERLERADANKMYFKINLDELNSQWESFGNKKIEKIEKPVVVEEKKKDLVDGIIEMMDAPGIKKMHVRSAMESYMATHLSINPSGKRWDDFFEYALLRHMKYNENFKVFIAWWIENHPDRTYWSADRMKQFWPSAFIKPALDKNDGFVVKLEDTQEEPEKEYAPLPRWLGRK